MMLVDANFITPDEQEIQHLLVDNPRIARQITLLLNGYRDLVQTSLLDGDRSDIQRGLLKKEQAMQRMGIPLLESPEDWQRIRRQI